MQRKIVSAISLHHFLYLNQPWMFYLNPLNMDQRIKSKILEAETVFDLLPGVVIIHHIQSQHVVYMSKLARETLNLTVEQVRQLGTDYHRIYFNPEEAGDYVPKILGLLERNNNDEFISFFQPAAFSQEQYRLRRDGRHQVHYGGCCW